MGEISTNFLTADSSFITGMASAASYGGNFYGFNYSESPAAADQLALLSDWLIVGQDVSHAIEQAELHPECLKAIK